MPQQTKGNLWAAATIWANIIIVFIAWQILLLVVGGLYDVTPFLNRGIQVILDPILTAIILVFAIWLGVPSVLRKTVIEPQNFFVIALYVVIFAAVIQIALIAYSNIGTVNLDWTSNWFFIIGNVVYDVVIFFSTFYFLKTGIKNKL